MCASAILSEVTVLSVAMSAGRITPAMCTYSSPWLSFKVLSPCTTRLPLAWTSVTVTVRLPAKLLLCVLAPSPSNESEPFMEVFRMGTPLVVKVLPNIVGPVFATAVAFVVLVTAFLLAAVDSFSLMVRMSPMRRAFRSKQLHLLPRLINGPVGARCGGRQRPRHHRLRPVIPGREHSAAGQQHGAESGAAGEP